MELVSMIRVIRLSRQELADTGVPWLHISAISLDASG